jgi:DNA-binding response OmpR family regulator
MENIVSYKKNARILLVEDEEVTQVKLLKILNRVYDNIVVAKNGDDALTIIRDFYLRGKAFDLVISDINMPVMDGVDLLKNVRHIDELLPFIFLTAQLDVKQLLDVVKLDINDYILKPIDVDPLLQSIEKTLNKSFKKSFLIGEKSSIMLENNFEWDIQDKILYKDNITVKLTKKELQLVDILCKNINRVVNTDDIINSIWDDIKDIESAVANLKNLISRLRVKIPDLNIENMYGFGYKLRMKDGRS